MLASDQVARSIGGKLGKSTKQLYSANGETLTDQDLHEVLSKAEEISKYPIYYVDDIGSVQDIERTIYNFVAEQNLIANQEGLVVTIDHILLTKGRQGEAEKAVIDDLTHTMVSIKKSLSARGLKILIILVGQLNREIERPERILNQNLQYPNRNDIFGASSIYQCSDYVMITHKPATIEGIAEFYGPERPAMGYPKGLPVYNPHNPTQAMVYWHLLKERFGDPKILMMLDSFKYSRVDEFVHKN